MSTVTRSRSTVHKMAASSAPSPQPMPQKPTTQRQQRQMMMDDDAVEDAKEEGEDDEEEEEQHEEEDEQAEHKEFHENADEMKDDPEETEEQTDDASMPSFPPLTASSASSAASPSPAPLTNSQYTRVAVPAHRYTPLKAAWPEIYTPIVEHMLLQIRFNPRKRCVELRTSAATREASALTKATDFVRAFLLGFEVKDAVALLRIEDLFLDSFAIHEVKTLNGEHLSRAIGRIAGQGGKTKFTIENATRTRIVLADTQVHILGSYTSIQIAKSAVVKLIMGAPTAKLFAQMHGVAARAKERY